MNLYTDNRRRIYQHLGSDSTGNVIVRRWPYGGNRLVKPSDFLESCTIIAPHDVATSTGAASAPLQSPSGPCEEAASVPSRFVQDFHNDKEAWLRERPSFLGGSDVADIVLRGKPYRCYMKKVQPDFSDDAGARARMGHYLEGGCIEAFNSEHGFEAEQNGLRLFRRVEAPYFAATPDAWIDNNTGLECKTRDAFKIRGFPRPLDGEIMTIGPETMVWSDEPADEREAQNRLAFSCYIVQCMWTMMVTDATSWYLAVLSNNDLYTYHILRDEDDCESLKAQAERFWHQHVKPQIEPPVDNGDPSIGEAQAKLWPESEPGFVVIDELNYGHLCQTWRDARTAKKTAEEAERFCRYLLQDAMRDAEEARVGNESGPRVTWKSTKGKNSYRKFNIPEARKK